tara:strand:+ start:746 stop:1630 length:885 start_codon:yes stop_codon:yes gene_type:complete
MIASLVSLIAPNGLKAGLEFTGGSSITLDFSDSPSQEALRSQLAELGHADAVIQNAGAGSYFIRTRTLKEAVGSQPSERESIITALETAFNTDIEIPDFFSVSPSIATETVRNAFFIVVIAALAILLYMTWAFRRVPSPFRYGVSAIVALIHDVLVVMGIFSLCGRYFDLEVNAMFIAGILTIIGYSVHDTIVVFDRVRENLIRGIGPNLGSTINISIQDTIGRSLNTSLTLLFTILALMIFGGPTILDFLVVLLIGIIVGTYSSIWIASQILLVWENGDLGRIIRRPFSFRGN